MRTVFLICCSLVVFVTQCSFAAESVGGLAQRLEATMLDTEMAHRDIAQEIAASTPEQRKQKIAAIVEVVDTAFRKSQPRSDNNDVLIMVSADVLRAVSDEDAILAAFGSRLMQVGNRAQPAVIGALSVCRSPKAAEMIAALARLRLQEAKALLRQLPSGNSVTDDQRRTANNIMDSLFYALEGLARSDSESRKALARELRDECFKLFEGSPYQKTIAEALKTEIDPLLHEIPRPTAVKP